MTELVVQWEMPTYAVRTFWLLQRHYIETTLN